MRYNSNAKKGSKIKVLSVADLFAIAIRNAYENRSITNLFIHSQLKAKREARD